jgi:hypothetical protein
MNKLLFITLISIFCLAGCEKESVVFYLDAIDKNKYYREEIIHLEQQNFYGNWRLFGISGGYFGWSDELDFDFLEVKPIGIYGLIRGDSIFEYGRIELDTFDANNSHILQIKIHPEKNSHYFFPPECQFSISIHADSLDMYPPYPDSYYYYFKRIK